MDTFHANFQALGKLIGEWMQTYQVPGVALGIIHDGREHMAGFGVTSIENPLPVHEDTLFQIGSTTKTVTGTAAMRLVEQGLLDLDAPLRTYLPDLRLRDESVAAQVTLRHLFTHMGGWFGDYFEDTGMGDDALAKYVANMATLPQLTPLGSVWSYNNAGFSLAGHVIEVVTGKRYEEVIQELIFDPLGMTNSFLYARDAITRRTAVGHQVRDGRIVVARPWALARSAHAAGGIASSVRDQLHYARFQIGEGTTENGTRLLSHEHMALMQSPLVPRDLGTHEGITWTIHETNGGRIVQHGGATNAQLSAFALVPAHRFAITVLTNGMRGGELHRAATKWALEHFVGILESELMPLDVPTEKLAAYAGTYTSGLADCELRVEDGKLMMYTTPKGGFPDKNSPPPPAPPPVRVALCGDDQVVVLDPPMKDLRGEFLRNPDGSIAWFRFGGRIRARERM